MGSFIAIAIVADFIITTAQQGITDDYSRRFMRGTITLIEDEPITRAGSGQSKSRSSMKNSITASR